MPSRKADTPTKTFWIAVPGDDDPATRAKDKRANILRVHDAHPGLSRPFFDLMLKLLFRPGPLSRTRREMIALCVSSINGCRYCTTHHGAAFRALLEREGASALEAARAAGAVVGERSSVLLSEPDLAMLAFARKLSQHPDAMIENDVVTLRAHGFDEQAIFDIVAITGLFNYVNRITQALGVPLKTNWREMLSSIGPR